MSWHRIGARARWLAPRLSIAAALVALLAVFTRGPGEPDPPARERQVAIEGHRTGPGRGGSTLERELVPPGRRRRGGPSAAQLLPYDSEHVRIDFGGERGGKVVIHVDHDVPAARARAAWRSLLERSRDRGDGYRVIYRPVGANAADAAQRGPLESAQAFADSFCAFQRGALPATALTPATSRLRAQLGGRPPENRAGVRPRPGPARLLSRRAGRATAEFLIGDGEALAHYRIALMSSGDGWAVDRLDVLSVAPADEGG